MDDNLSLTQLILMEVVLSGATVLKNSFGFTEEQVDEWLEETIITAQARRAQIETEVAINAVS